MTDLELFYDLKRLSHVYMPQHAYLAEGFSRQEGPNIGSSGENLTIMFLSMDRASLSERLCKSIVEHIPHFQGEVLAIDNGSQAEQLKLVEEMLDALPLKTRIVKLGQNYGVAAGRNRGLEQVQTEWVMSVDNDTYFICDPLRHWQSEIAVTGCLFFSLALYDKDQKSVFLRGGNLHVRFSEGEVHLGSSSAGHASDSRQCTGDPFLGTCMMGRAAIFDAERFRRLGGFDENMFVGFEDVEFSLRLFHEGYKVGCTALAALVHDHTESETIVDKTYEETRFRRKYITESAKYFEKKHGFRVWNKDVEEWLVERECTLGLNPGQQSEISESSVPSAISTTLRPRIMLVPDVDGWAFSNICRQIEKHLGDVYDITTVAVTNLDHFGQLPLLARDQDLMHVFWRPQIYMMFSEELQPFSRSIGFYNPDDYFRLILDTRVTTAIYDHLFLEPETQPRYHELLANFVDGYYTSSEKLTEIYRTTYPDAVPQETIQDGVDTTLFRPLNLNRLSEIDRPLVLGWVGNSRWSAAVEDFKGLHSIIKPAVEQLRAEGMNLHTNFADRDVTFIPHAAMPEYYSKIDVLLCASKIEGTPNPVLEAMACGVPVISTDVGIVSEALGPLQKEFVLSKRSIFALKSAIRRLDETRHLLPVLSTENLVSVENWDWRLRVQKFRRFFDHVLQQPVRPKRPI